MARQALAAAQRDRGGASDSEDRMEAMPFTREITLI